MINSDNIIPDSNYFQHIFFGIYVAKLKLQHFVQTSKLVVNPCWALGYSFIHAYLPKIRQVFCVNSNKFHSICNDEHLFDSKDMYI
jgi:hypothetical protein